jgi:hypothetical protein
MVDMCHMMPRARPSPPPPRGSPGGTLLALSPHSHIGLKSSLINQETTMRSILLWLIGVPIPIIILIALFAH